MDSGVLGRVGRGGVFPALLGRPGDREGDLGVLVATAVCFLARVGDLEAVFLAALPGEAVRRASDLGEPGVAGVAAVAPADLRPGDLVLAGLLEVAGCERRERLVDRLRAISEKYTNNKFLKNKRSQSK